MTTFSDAQIEAARTAVHRAFASEWALIAAAVEMDQAQYDSLLSDVARAALEAVEALEEVEWEYGSKGYCFDWDDRRCRFTATALSAVIAHEDEMHGGNASRPVRRRKAGPWIALEGETP